VDDVADDDYLQGFIDRGEPLPVGSWELSRPLVVPGDGMVRALLILLLLLVVLALVAVRFDVVLK
jgi:hypothetical protein